MMDFDPLSLIVGFAFGVVLCLVVAAMAVGAKPDPYEQDEPY